MSSPIFLTNLRKGLKRYSFPILLLLPALIWIFSLSIYPTIDVIRLSFTSDKVPGVVGPYCGLDNYIRLIKDSRFWMVMRNTIGLAFLELVLRILVALPIALLFNEARKYGETFCAFLLLPGTISGVVISFIIQWIFNPAYGLANWYLMTFGILSEPLEITKNVFTAWTALILASIWGGYPGTVIILFAALRAIPEDLYESAKVDGAGAFNRFLHVTLPWLKPALRYLIILGTIFGLRGFFIFSYIITKGGPAGQTDVYGTYLFRTLLNNYQFGYASALSVFMLILNFVMIAFYLKFFKARIY